MPEKIYTTSCIQKIILPQVCDFTTNTLSAGNAGQSTWAVIILVGQYRNNRLTYRSKTNYGLLFILKDQL